jgi:hypothetical protein
VVHLVLGSLIIFPFELCGFFGATLMSIHPSSKSHANKKKVSIAKENYSFACLNLTLEAFEHIYFGVDLFRSMKPLFNVTEVEYEN